LEIVSEFNAVLNNWWACGVAAAHHPHHWLAFVGNCRRRL